MVSDVLTNTWPIEILCDTSQSFSYTHVSPCRCAMILREQSGDHGKSSRQPNAFLVKDQIVSNGEMRMGWWTIPDSFSMGHISRVCLQLLTKLRNKGETGHWECHQWGRSYFREARQSICNLIVVAEMINDLVIIAHQPCQVSVLLRCLNCLCEQFFEASMISDDQETMPE